MNIGDLVKIKGSRESYERNIQHKIAQIIGLKCGGEVVRLRLESGREIVMAADEVDPNGVLESGKRRWRERSFGV